MRSTVDALPGHKDRKPAPHVEVQRPCPRTEAVPLRVLRAALPVLLILTLASPAAADIGAPDVAAMHEAHGHHQWQHGRGTEGHTWAEYRRQARALNAYARAAARAKILACSREPHCAVRLASYLTHAPYRLVDAVVRCESGYDPNAANPSSTAGGLGQWLASSWASHAPGWGMAGRSRFEVWPAALVTSGVIAQGGISNWAASRGCWS